MPRYFFNIRSRTSLIIDDEGEDQPNIAAARSQAVQAARELMAGAVLRGQEPDGDIFEIMNEAGKLLLALPFRDAFIKVAAKVPRRTAAQARRVARELALAKPDPLKA